MCHSFETFFFLIFNLSSHYLEQNPIITHFHKGTFIKKKIIIIKRFISSWIEEVYFLKRKLSPDARKVWEIMELRFCLWTAAKSRVNWGFQWTPMSDKMFSSNLLVVVFFSKTFLTFSIRSFLIECLQRIYLKIIFQIRKVIKKKNF